VPLRSHALGLIDDNPSQVLHLKDVGLHVTGGFAFYFDPEA